MEDVGRVGAPAGAEADKPARGTVAHGGDGHQRPQGQGPLHVQGLPTPCPVQGSLDGGLRIVVQSRVPGMGWGLPVHPPAHRGLGTPWGSKGLGSSKRGDRVTLGSQRVLLGAPGIGGGPLPLPPLQSVPPPRASSQLPAWICPQPPPTPGPLEPFTGCQLASQRGLGRDSDFQGLPPLSCLSPPWPPHTPSTLRPRGLRRSRPRPAHLLPASPKALRLRLALPPGAHHGPCRVLPFMCSVPDCLPDLLAFAGTGTLRDFARRVSNSLSRKMKLRRGLAFIRVSDSWVKPGGSEESRLRV